MNDARQFIEVLASNMLEVNKPLNSIKAVLEDGEALMHLGATDEDQEIVEEAHDLVCRWIMAGITTLDEVDLLWGEITQSSIISSNIFSSHLRAETAISDLRELCYKLASSYFHESCPAKQKASYALADKYQAVLEALHELDGVAREILDIGFNSAGLSWDD